MAPGLPLCSLLVREVMMNRSIIHDFFPKLENWLFRANKFFRLDFFVNKFLPTCADNDFFAFYLPFTSEWCFCVLLVIFGPISVHSDGVVVFFVKQKCFVIKSCSGH